MISHTYEFPEQIYRITCFNQEEEIDKNYFTEDNIGELVDQAIEYLKFAYKKGNINIESEKYETEEEELFSIYHDTYNRHFHFPKGIWIEIETIDIMDIFKYPKITVLDKNGNKILYNCDDYNTKKYENEENENLHEHENYLVHDNWDV